MIVNYDGGGGGGGGLDWCQMADSESECAVLSLKFHIVQNVLINKISHSVVMSDKLTYYYDVQQFSNRSR